MSSRPLNNDRTNYLIWRYLQEHGHAQTAARFQVDWGNKDPDNLPFSQFVRTHSLVYLLQKGLRYHELELTINQNAGNGVQPFFGPDEASTPAGGSSGNENDAATTRKHARDSMVNGIPGTDSSSLSATAPAAKRSRRSNGQAGSASATNGGSRGAKSGDAMDVDEAPTKREPGSSDSPPGSAAPAQGGDGEMELDADSKANAFQRSGYGENAEGISTTTTTNNTLYATVEAAAGSGVRLGSEDVGASTTTGRGNSSAAAAGGAENSNGALGGWNKGQLQLGRELQNQAHTQAQAQHLPPAEAVERPPPMPTLKDGRSVGVQSDKVSAVPDLASETAVLRVPGKNVTHALWSPRDPALLATGGDALCRLWAIPTASHLLARSGARQASLPPKTDELNNNSTPNGHANGNDANADNSAIAPNVLNLDSSSIVDLQQDASDSEITSMAWSPDGERIAIARRPKAEGRGDITIYSKKGGPLDELPGGMEWVTNLFWNPSGTLLLGISHSDNTNSTLMVWSVASGTAIKPLKVDQPIIDAAWRNDRSFIVCGDNLIAQTSVLENSIEPLNKRDDEAQEWSRVCYDPITDTTAVASDTKGILALFNASGPLKSTLAHGSGITALKFQPLANPSSLTREAPRLLATGGADGSITVWDAKKPITPVHEFSLGKQSQTLALSFTPDGYLIAAASMDRIVFWNAEAGGEPKAVWNGSNAGWPSSSEGVNGHTKPEENGDIAMTDADSDSPPSLSWDSDGGKIAFGAKEEVGRNNFVTLQLLTLLDCHSLN